VSQKSTSQSILSSYCVLRCSVEIALGMNNGVVALPDEVLVMPLPGVVLFPGDPPRARARVDWCEAKPE